MLENFFVEFIVVFITASFGLLYHLYGFPLNHLGKKTYCHGDGYDLYNLSGKHREGEEFFKNDFKNDFKRDRVYNYTYKNIVITKTYSKVYIKGYMSAIDEGGTQRESLFSGKGEFLSDSNDFAFINVKNSRKTNNENVSWNCVYFLRFTATSEIEGYWVTQDSEKNGRFVMGRFLFMRTTSSVKN